MEQTTHDVAVIGAGVAGAGCALLAARQGLRVVLIERQQDSDAPPRPDWMPTRALALLAQREIDVGPVVGPPFDGATFHSADLAKHAETSESEPPAYRVDYSRLVGHLRHGARQAGVALHHGAAPEAIECGETSVRLTWANHAPVEARFLIRADGIHQPATQATRDSRAWLAELHLTGLDGPAHHQLHWILGLDGGRTLASWWWDGVRVMARIAAFGPPDEVRQRLIGCVRQAIAYRWLCGRPRIEPGNVVLRAAPAHHALEMDTHVGKRTLWIGDAGGFVAAATREGIEPALRSAVLAAETLVAAARHRTPQDVLQEFDVSWRSGMAEELGTPETHTPMLLPLIFRNSQMAQRLAGAFWYGRRP